MAFLSDLGNIINEQFGYGESSKDRTFNYGLLGKFASKIDKTAERTYIEDGLINNTRPRMREVLFQEPDITVVIKKKMFSSLIENSRLDLLEQKERLFIRASKKLFQNKLKLLSAYERLSKVEKISRECGEFNTALVPSVLQGITDLENAGFNIIAPETRAAIDTLRTALAHSDSSNFSSWVQDYDTAFVSDLGEGTGVMELTTVASMNTNIGTDFGSGSASFTIEDPYNILRITQKDIDQAISDAQNFFRQSAVGRFAEIETQKLIDDLQNRLNSMRLIRSASPIRFVISPQTIISQKVRVIMEGIGLDIKFEYNSGLVGIGSQVQLDQTGIDSVNTMREEEEVLFKEIISNIYLLLGFMNTTKAKVKEFNAEMNYVRNRMRLMFKNKSCIQNMDIVNIFMTTKTTNDSKLTEGFPGFQTTGYLNQGQKINNLVRGINAGIADLSGAKTSPDEVEKSAIVGPNFPTWLWRLFRNNFTKQGAGTAVFVGLVKRVSQKTDSGKHVIQVECKDNTEYFGKSQINVKPVMNVFNSTLYDPLTPFDVSFDAGTGQAINNVNEAEFPPLLPENQKLLETRAIKFKTTDFRGQNANQLLYKTKKGEVVFGKLRKVLADTDGFVYRWKQGIHSLTFSDSAAGTLGTENPIALTASPYAGQDVMNVLSMLITGQPYNFNTFLQSALANANDILAYDPSNNEDQYASYIDGLLRELTKRNVIWGNFIPFKSMSVNEEAFAFIRQGQADLSRRQGNLQSLLRQRAAKMDARKLYTAGVSDPNDQVPLLDTVLGMDSEIFELDKKIENERNLFSLTESELFSSKTNGTIKLVGDDISFEPGFDDQSGSNSGTQGQIELSRQELRRQINTLALRRLWKVKANNDPNLFIVDDQYDKNYDIQAFERKIGPRLDIFNSEYMTVDSQIKVVAEILGLEIFADTQGHIRVRPPLYNRMPSSVFYKMFKDRDESGVKVFPDFLESLLFNQVQSVQNRIEIVEDEIRYRAIALGVSGSDAKDTDISIRNFIRGANSSQPYGSTGFLFLSDPSTGRIPGELIQAIPMQAAPEAREQIEDKNISALEDLNTRALNQLQVSKAFDTNTRVQEIQKRDFGSDIIANSGDSKAQIIRNRLLKNKGIRTKTEQELFSNTDYKKITGKVSDVDTLNVVNQISGFVSERQKLVKILANITKNLQEGLQVNQNDAGAKRALTPFLNRKTSLPAMLEHMIEDETLDDIGIGSGNRFCIKESQIISMDISENPPPFTAIQVNGLFAQGAVNPVSGLSANIGSSRDGNVVTSAYAVDYDMWYQYGFISSNSVSAPWASDPDTQCAPFAVSLLNKSRRHVFSGSITINGWNEFYQAGDVVYIEDQDMLFYVSSVQHSFSYSGSLSTTLSLTYGHNPGEYIPTHLDMIGKYLYSAQTFSEGYRSSRFSVDGDDINIGCLMVNSASGLETILTGPNGKRNRDILSKILYSASGSINPNHFSTSKPIIELRVYVENKKASVLRAVVEDIRNYLINPQVYSTLNSKIIPNSNLKSNFMISGNDIKMREIDIDNDTSAPSGAAWNSVRLIESSGGVPGIQQVTGDVTLPPINFDKQKYKETKAAANALDDILMHNIIDVWVTFETQQETFETGDQKNQAQQEMNTKVDIAKAAGRS